MRALLPVTMFVILAFAGCVSVAPDAGGEEELVRIRGQVLDASSQAPVAGAKVLLEPEAGGRRSVTTVGNGTFALHVPPGPCHLTVQAAGRVEGSFALDCSVPRFVTIRLATATGPILEAPIEAPVDDPREPLFRVTGVVRSEAGEPLEGARVVLRQGGQSVGDHLTDTSGAYAFRVAAGSYALVVQVPCTDGVQTDVTVLDNLTLDAIVAGAPDSVPGAPTGLEAIAGPGPGQVTLRWRAPESQEPVKAYVIHRDGEPFQQIGNSVAWADSLYSGGSHEYAVSARDVCGQQGPASRAVAGAALPGGQLPIRVSTSPASGITAAIEHYPVLSANGTPAGQQAWRTVSGVGNCCETYVAADATGRLYEYGGTYILYSDDRGMTWQRVGTPTPQTGAEGAIVPAPGGDVLAFNWSPYTGDQLWAHKYVAALDAWYYQQIPLHQPFYDRPWISVIEGPFEAGDVVAPYVALVMSNYVHGDLMQLSLDGLHYAVPSQRSTTALGGSLTLDWDLPPDPDRDWTQAMRESLVVPIDDGQGLRGRATLSSCPWGALTPQLTWACPGWGTLQGSPTNQDSLRVDSNGHLHWLTLGAGAGSMTYRVSHDGGATWQAVTAMIPRGLVAEDWDFKANGAHGLAVVAVHASQSTDASTLDQDLVFKFRGTDRLPYLAEIMEVGLGDHPFGGGLTSEYDRLDYTTVAILPDGKVALSFGDSKHTPPGIAIEV